MSTEEHNLLKDRIKLILSEYGDWIWNDLSKILSIVWKYEIKFMIEMDSESLSAQGFLNGLWREKVTPAEDIYEVFKELQSVNNNHKSNTLNMENSPEKVPHRIPVLAHLKSGKTLTGLQAWRLFGCYRLSSVIDRLNEVAGIKIECKIIDGERYGEYKLIS